MQNKVYINIYLFLFLNILCFFSLFFIGRYSISPYEIFNTEKSVQIYYILLYVRLPRILAALLVGISLSLAGATYQAVFRNPMVSPDILGASSGSAFGIAFGIIQHYGYFQTIFFAFCMGLLAVGFSYTISRLFPQEKQFSLLLSGIMISAIFSSLLSFIKLIADIENELPDITYWLMGRLSGVSYRSLIIIILPFLVGVIIIAVLRWRINIFTIGTQDIQTLGMSVEKIRFLLIVASTLLTTITVSICGIIGFVGLIIPHFSRLLIGHNYQNLIPTTMLVGAIFLLVVDNFARTLSTYEIPLGILTSLVGAPIFLFLMIKGRYD